MLTQILIAPLIIAASAVAHPAVVRRGDVPLSEWSSQNLESYWRFKVRYNSLNCASQAGTDFYTNCCYPLGAAESLSDRPAECTPASLTCGGVPSISSLSPPPAPPAPPSNEGGESDDDYDESTLPWCEDGQDEYDDWTQSVPDNGSNNGGSPSPDNSTPTDNNTQPPPTDNGNTGDNSGDNNNNNSGGGDYGAQQTGGHATYYYQNGNAGACGEYRSDNDLIGAIDSSWWGDLGQRSSYCGRTVHITNLNNGRSVDIVVADACPTCDGNNSFDLSVAAFQAIDDLGAGYVPITWSFV